jgi:hypothetical protein
MTTRPWIRSRIVCPYLQTAHRAAARTCVLKVSRIPENPLSQEPSDVITPLRSRQNPTAAASANLKTNRPAASGSIQHP